MKLTHTYYEIACSSCQKPPEGPRVEHVTLSEAISHITGLDDWQVNSLGEALCPECSKSEPPLRHVSRRRGHEH